MWYGTADALIAMQAVFGDRNHQEGCWVARKSRCTGRKGKICYTASGAEVAIEQIHSHRNPPVHPPDDLSSRTCCRPHLQHRSGLLAVCAPRFKLHHRANHSGAWAPRTNNRTITVTRASRHFDLISKHFPPQHPPILPFPFSHCVVTSICLSYLALFLTQRSATN